MNGEVGWSGRKGATKKVICLLFLNFPCDFSLYSAPRWVPEPRLQYLSGLSNASRMQLSKTHESGGHGANSQPIPLGALQYVQVRKITEEKELVIE